MSAYKKPAYKQIRDRVQVDQDVWSLALERTAYIMDSFDQVSVSFSGGKDSTATLMVALEVAHSDPRFARHLPLKAIFWDEEAIPFETEEYVRRVSQRDDVELRWMCMPVQHRNACSRRSPYWWPWDPDQRDLWCRPLPPEAITEWSGFPVQPPMARPGIPHCGPLVYRPEDGNTIELLGIRADESLNRARMVSRKPVDNYITPNTDARYLSKGYPIYDWSVNDVWTAPAQLGWDYNHAYDRLEMAGVSATQQRCSPAFGEEPLQKLHTYAACFPEVWDKMVDRVPGAGAAVRYALTELYSYGKRPEKPAGLPWTDFIRHYLAKFDQEAIAFTIGKIHDEIRRHYRKTTDPILVKAMHPISGLSWNHLLMLAMRGDFKDRKQAGANLPGKHEEDLAPLWRKYVAELEQILAAGTFPELCHPGPPPADPQALLPAYARLETL